MESMIPEPACTGEEAADFRSGAAGRRAQYKSSVHRNEKSYFTESKNSIHRKQKQHSQKGKNSVHRNEKAASRKQKQHLHISLKREEKEWERRILTH